MKTVKILACAWVLWKMNTGLNVLGTPPNVPLQAFSTRSECVSAQKQIKPERKAGKKGAEAILFECFPDTLNLMVPGKEFGR